MFNKINIIIKFILLITIFSVFIYGEDTEEKLKWIEDDGLEIKIVKPINPEKCKIKSQAGDIVDQYYKLSDKDGQVIGTNWGKKP